MLDLGTYDFGTTYELTVPEPENPLTVDWGSCMARNTAKLTKAFRVIGTCTIGSMGTYEITATRANFFDFPFTKLYSYVQSGAYWTDYQFVGTGNFLFTTTGAQETRFDIDRETLGTLRVLIGSNDANLVTGAWNLYQYGK